MALGDFPIPGIRFFLNKNSFCGSHKALNYRITPIKADADAGVEAHFEVVIWYGMLCSECSEMQGEAQFSLDADGLAAVCAWLREQYAAMPQE